MVLDPVNAAGLGLGAASVAMQILDGVLKGYRYFERAAHADHEARVFQMRLQIEQCRILDWAVVTGLRGEESHQQYNDCIGPNRAIVIGILGEMGSNLEVLKQHLHIQPAVHTRVDDQAIQEKLSFIVPPGSELLDGTKVPSNNASTTVGSSKLKRRNGLGRMLRFMAGITDIAKEPWRLKWAVLDRERCLDGLGRLHELTDYLHKLAGESRMRDLLQSSCETELALLSLTESIEGLKSLMTATETQSLPSIPDSGLLNGAGSSIISDPCLQSPMRELASFKFRMRKASHEKETAVALPPEYVLQLQESQQYDREGRTMILLNDEIFWVEWKRYTPQNIVQRTSSYIFVPDAATLQRVQRLAFILQQEKPNAFRVPHCIGYFDDSSSQRFGLVFKQPPCEGNIPCSLRSMLGSGKISLSERVRIAQQLADAMLYLHAVGWLHKGFRSTSVIFFSRGMPGLLDEKCKPLPGLQQTYISDFEFSRPDKSDLTTTAPPDVEDYACYVHPEYYHQTSPQRFTRSFDIYSLGIVLIELAYWEPVIDLVKRLAHVSSQAKDTHGQSETLGQVYTPPSSPATCMSNDSITDPRAIQASTMQEDGEVASHIRMAMGQRYLEAVQSCIGGLNMGSGNEFSKNAYLQQAFITQVVEPLKTIIV